VSWIEGVTSDGHLVTTRDRDLVVVPAGATQAAVLVKDYDSSYDEVVVRGRTVSAWLGEDLRPSAMTTWTAAGGLKTAGPVAWRGAVYPKPGTDVFAFRGNGPTSWRSTLAVLSPGQATPSVLASSLDTGALEPSCRPWITWAGSDLLVGGCFDGTTTFKVALCATDGSGTKTTILDGASPGVWPNRARSRALVQTKAASSIRSLSAVGAPVPLDTPVRQAIFSDDDSRVVYLRSDGKIRRAATSVPTAPIDLGTGIMLLGSTPDARFTAFATKQESSSQRTDVILADASAPQNPRTLAADKAVFHGFSPSGSALVYQTMDDVLAVGPLFVVPTAGGPAVKISDEAQRVTFDGGVVYFQEFQKAAKTNVLKAARIAQPETTIVIEAATDPLTTQVALAAGKLFVASKVGLWVYPAVTP
jgi:hypothetical protein